jgi:hypothetical protein
LLVAFSPFDPLFFHLPSSVLFISLSGVIKTITERFDGPAQQAHCCIMPGCGFDYALPEVTTQLLVRNYNHKFRHWPAQVEKTLQINYGREGMVARWVCMALSRFQ